MPILHQRSKPWQMAKGPLCNFFSFRCLSSYIVRSVPVQNNPEKERPLQYYSHFGWLDMGTPPKVEARKINHKWRMLLNIVKDQGSIMITAIWRWMLWRLRALRLLVLFFRTYCTLERKVNNPHEKCLFHGKINPNAMVS